MLEWKVELSSGCYFFVEYARKFGERVTARLGGEIITSDIRKIKRGTAYDFKLGERVFTLNSIVVRGIRYVSLYDNSKLVSEYCYDRERYKKKLEKKEPSYLSVAEFIKTVVWTDLIISGFILSLAIFLIDKAFDAFDTMANVFLICSCVLVGSFILVMTCHMLIYLKRRRTMLNLGLLDIKRRNKTTYGRMSKRSKKQ